MKQKIVDEREAEGRPEAAELRTPNVVTGKCVSYAERLDPVAFYSHPKDDYRPKQSKVQGKLISLGTESKE